MRLLLVNFRKAAVMPLWILGSAESFLNCGVTVWDAQVMLGAGPSCSGRGAQRGAQTGWRRANSYAQLRQP